MSQNEVKLPEGMIELVPGVAPAVENTPEKEPTPKVEETQVVDNTATETPPETSKPESVSEPKKNVGYEKRIGKLTKKIAEKDEALAVLQRQVEELNKRIPKAEPEPKEFETADEFVKDTVKKTLKEEREEQARKDAEAKALADEDAAVMAKWNDKMKKFADANPDVNMAEWQETAADMDKQAAAHLGEYAHESPLGAEILHELFSDPDMVEKFNGMTARYREKFLNKLEDKIEARLESASKQTPNDSDVDSEEEQVEEVVETPKPKKVPLDKPPTPGKGGGAGSLTGKSLDELAKKSDLTEYMEKLKAMKKK